ncbi:MAG: hypothetical protein RLZZ162_4207 [Verrucomicrobiota bacterium]
MPQSKHLPVDTLKLDLQNYRTVPQRKETSSIHAMISINPDWFWALANSLVDDGYHPTENIIVLKTGEKNDEMTVKEGNRRIGALKLILGQVPPNGLSIPDDLKVKIEALADDWKTANATVPCTIYEPTEAAQVDRIVTLTHGKGEKAGRDKWNAVAKARHNRDKGQASEPALDLLEKYLKSGLNITAEQQERWGGDYPLTVLEEALKRIAPRVGATTAREVADQYPNKSKYRSALEGILHDTGLGTLDFQGIRDSNEDFAAKYRIPPPVVPARAGATGAVGRGQKPMGAASAANATKNAGGTANENTKAVSTKDPRSVKRTLRQFEPRGNNRSKLVALLDEAKTLKLDKHPHSFCFLLRSMFEISAKAYCTDNQASGLSAVKKDQSDKNLAEVLREITAHMTKNNSDKAVLKELHGAIAELGKPSGFLSVTSMNQLVHNPKFSIDETHISTLFNNVFPLLEAMNR